MRIGAGHTDAGEGITNTKRYLEEIANARLFFSNITLGLRYELDDLSEVGPSFQGLRRRWTEYAKDKLTLQAGDVYALYGRGLTMNAFESRPLNYDSWLDGIKGEYEYAWSKDEYDFRPSLGVKMIAGKLNYRDIVDSTHILTVSSQAFNTQLGLFGKKVLVGGSFLHANTSYPELSFGSQVFTLREVNQPEFYVNFFTGALEGFFQYAQVRTNLTQIFGEQKDSNHTGNAFYGSLSYSGEDLGLTFEYKNYGYYIHPAREPNKPTYFSKLPISNPPEVYKEFTYTSLTRTTHSVNFDDELGFQIEANITAIPENVITLYAAASSWHNSYDDTLHLTGTTDILPKFSGTTYYPFWEYFVEVEHEFGGLDYLKLFAHRRSEVIHAAPLEEQSSTTIGAKLQYETSKSQSFLASFEHQWMTSYQRIINDHKFLNELLTVQYSFNPIITFGGVLDFCTRYEESRHIWPQVFVSFRIGGSHTVLASFGSERGGLNCTGGICRVVPAFDGARVTITSQI